MHESTSDIALLRAWQRHGDAEAFHTLLQRHAGLVYNTCRRVVRNEEDAADVSQECFLSLAATPPDIQKSLAGFLHRLATHRALDHLKATNRRRAREVRYESASQRKEALPVNELMEWVDEAIDLLPDELRVPLVEHFLHQKTHQEVADSIGVPRRTVSKRINRAVDEIREHLRAQGAVVSGAALLAFLEAQATDAAPVPATLLSALGKQAVAGSASAKAGAAASSGLIQSGWLWAAAAVLAGLAGWFFIDGLREPTEPLAGAPEATLPPATQVDENQQATFPPATPVASPDDTVAAALAGTDAGAIIAGRVFDEATNIGLPGVKVTAALTGATQTAVSNDRGEYRLENLPQGTAAVTVGSTEGYFPMENTEQEATLASGSVSFVDFALIPGQFTGVSGIVINEVGNPVANATVTAWSQPYLGGTGQTREVQSADDGTFEINGLQLDAGLFLRGTTEERTCAPIGPMRLGNEGLIDQQLTVHPVADVSGSVVDDEGSAVDSDYYVRAKLQNAAQPTAGVDVDEEGNFALTSLAPGSYELYVEAKAYSFSGWAVPQATIELAAGESVRDVVLETQLPKVIASIERGEGVRYEEEPRSLGTIQGVVRDASTGAPIQAFSLVMNEHELGISHHKKEVSSEDGVYSMPVRDVESVVLTISAAGYGSETTTVWPESFTPPVTTINFALQPGAVVKGTVVDQAGTPITGAEVLVNVKLEEVLLSLERDEERIFSDASGNFTLDSLRPEPTRIYVIHPTYAYAWLDITPTRAEPLRPNIPLRPGGTIEGRVLLDDAPVPNQPIMAFNIAMRDLGYFRAMTDANGRYSMAHLVPGQYEIYTFLRPEDNHSSMGGLDAQRMHRQTSVSDAQTTSVDLAFARGTAALSGQITINGAPPEGQARVELHSGSGNATRWQQNAHYEDGQYIVEGLPDGPALIKLMAQDASGVRYVHEVSIVLLPLVEFTQDIALTGTPMHLSLSGIAEAQRIDIFVYDGEIAAEALTANGSDYVDRIAAIISRDENGLVEVNALPPGRYTLQATLYNNRSSMQRDNAVQTLTVDIGSETDASAHIDF